MNSYASKRIVIALLNHWETHEPGISDAELAGAGEWHAPLTVDGLEFLPNRRKWHNHRYPKEKMCVWRLGT